jgi:hypothetical protein
MTVYVCGFGVMQSLLTCSTSSFKVAKFYYVFLSFSNCIAFFLLIGDIFSFSIPWIVKLFQKMDIYLWLENIKFWG